MPPAMDGYAVRAADAASVPAELKLVGEAAAGHAFEGSVGEGDAVRIFTGAPLPPGADAVVIQEDTEALDDGVRILEAAQLGRHIRKRGIDFEERQILLTSGLRLGARQLMLAAGMNHARLPARRKPRVAILATGDELVMPGETPRADQIISSVPYGLAALFTRFGAAPERLGIAQDTRASLRERITAGQDADILVTIGGASVGEHDLVASALTEAGMEMDFWKIAMRPGKPLMFGRLGQTRVIGVPGNPVSAMICARVFVVPLIARLLGGADALAPAQVPLGDVIAENGPRQHYMRGTLRGDENGSRVVFPADSQDSSLMATLAESDCLIVPSASRPCLAQR